MNRFFLLCAIFFAVQLTAQDSLVQNGYVTLKFPGGKRSGEGLMKDGKPEGLWKAFYESGAIKSEGFKKNGISDSLWKFYNEEGLIKTTIEYKNGKKFGLRRDYSADGNLITEETFENDFKSGKSTRFFKNKNPQTIIPFVEGKEEGRGVEFDSLGLVINLFDYKKGVLISRKIVNRTDKQNRKTGAWVDLFPDFTIKLEATYQSGLKNGYLKSYDKRGNLTLVERYVDDVLQQEAEDAKPPEIRKSYSPNGIVKRSGPITPDGKLTGQQLFFDDQGKPSTAEYWSNGILIASGTLDSIYRKQGHWKEFYPSKELKSEGSYLDDQRNGSWTFFYANGKTEQKGNFKKGKPDGKWLWYYESGKVLREENYRSGKEDGLMFELSETGDTLATGEYLEGDREGAWMFKQGEQTIRGKFVAGLMDGEWKHTFSSGNTAFTGSFRNGKAEGKHQAFRSTGKLYWEGKYIDGKRVGFWRSFDSEGMLYLVVEYRDGVEIGYDGVKIKPEFEPADYEYLLQESTIKF
jgi:antitoxin component YwqK of YwqJK toxin-antitoxin module